MIVAPNSPSPRANESTSPALRPPRASGSATREKTRQGPAPSVRAAATSVGSTPSSAAAAAPPHHPAPAPPPPPPPRAEKERTQDERNRTHAPRLREGDRRAEEA